MLHLVMLDHIWWGQYCMLLGGVGTWGNYTGRLGSHGEAYQRSYGWDAYFQGAVFESDSYDKLAPDHVCMTKEHVLGWPVTICCFCKKSNQTIVFGRCSNPVNSIIFFQFIHLFLTFPFPLNHVCIKRKLIQGIGHLFLPNLLSNIRSQRKNISFCWQMNSQIIDNAILDSKHRCNNIYGKLRVHFDIPRAIHIM